MTIWVFARLQAQCGSTMYMICVVFVKVLTKKWVCQNRAEYGVLKDWKNTQSRWTTWTGSRKDRGIKCYVCIYEMPSPKSCETSGYEKEPDRSFSIPQTRHSRGYPHKNEHHRGKIKSQLVIVVAEALEWRKTRNQETMYVKKYDIRHSETFDINTMEMNERN